MTYARNRRDSNEAEIIRILRTKGYWEQLRSATHDGNWHANGVTFNIEIKNGKLSPSHRRLTQIERQFKHSIELRGVRLWILLNPEDALNLVNGNYAAIPERTEYETQPFDDVA